MAYECELCGCPIVKLDVLKGPIKICPDCGVGAIVFLDPDAIDQELDAPLGNDEGNDLDVHDDYVHTDVVLAESSKKLGNTYETLVEEVSKEVASSSESPKVEKKKGGPLFGDGKPKLTRSASAPLIGSRPQKGGLFEKGKGKKENPMEVKKRAQQELESAQEKIVAIGNKDDKVLAKKLIAVQLLVTESIIAMAKTDTELARSLLKDDLNDKVDKLLEGEATFLELVAIADAINANIDLAAKGESADPAAFLTSSAWASLGGVVLTLVSTANLLRIWSSLGRGEKALKGTQALLDIAHKGAGATTAIAGWVNPSSVGATGVSVVNVASAVGSALGIVIGTINYAIELKNVADMQLIKDRYNVVKKAAPNFRSHMQQVKKDKEGMDWLLYKILKKVKRRKYRAGIGAGSSAAAVLGSGWALGGTIAAIAGGAACVPVVGWVCLGVATVGAFGLLGYKIGRKVYKKDKLKKYRTGNPRVWVPKWISTTGEFNRFRAAAFIHAACSGSPQLSASQRKLGTVWAWILFGNTRDEAVKEALGLGIAGIMAFIKG